MNNNMACVMHYLQPAIDCRTADRIAQNLNTSAACASWEACLVSWRGADAHCGWESFEVVLITLCDDGLKLCIGLRAGYALAYTIKCPAMISVLQEAIIKQAF